MRWPLQGYLAHSEKGDAGCFQPYIPNDVLVLDAVGDKVVLTAVGGNGVNFPFCGAMFGWFGYNEVYGRRFFRLSGCCSCHCFSNASISHQDEVVPSVL